MTQTVLIAGINYGLTLIGVPGTVTLSSAFSFTFRAFGGNGPYTFAESGSLPSGFTFTDNGNGTATLAGTTTAAGSFPFAVTLSDATRNVISRNFTLVVQAAPLSISGHIVGGTAGSAASGSYVASGGIAPYTYSIVSGTFPTTGGINSSTGAATGNWSAGGSYSWTVRVTDHAGTFVDLPDSTTVANTPISITGTYTSTVAYNASYSSDIVITGGSGSYTSPVVASGTAPPGLSLSIVNVSGVQHLRLSGTNTGHETLYTFTVGVTDTASATGTSSSQSIQTGDQFFSSVISLHHFDGTNGGTTFTDVKGNTMTAIGSPTTDNTHPAFGPTALKTSATAGIKYAASALAAIGTGPFTIEGWLYSTGISGGDGFYTVFRPPMASHAVYVESIGGVLQLIWYNGGSAQRSGTITPNTLHSWAITRDSSGNVRNFVDGVIGSVVLTGDTSDFTSNSTAAAIGINTNGNNEGFPNGWIDEVRVSKVCRYTASYTPSAIPFSDF